MARKSEAGNERFHGRRVTKVRPEVKHGHEVSGPLNLAAAGRFRWPRAT
jgi:hypothetical protein